MLWNYLDLTDVNKLIILYEIESGETENQYQANDNQIPDQRQNLQKPAEKTNYPNIQQKLKETNIDQPRKNPMIKDNKLYWIQGKWHWKGSIIS